MPGFSRLVEITAYRISREFLPLFQLASRLAFKKFKDGKGLSAGGLFFIDGPDLKILGVPTHPAGCAKIPSIDYPNWSSL